MKRILVIGAGGQLGRALVAQLGARAHAAGRAQVDLLRPDFLDALQHFCAGGAYDALINAAAYTQVDKAEGEGQAEAFRVNCDAPAELARWCAVRGLPMVHVSTDYVFDGSGHTPRREDEPANPINAYGESKWLGEEAVRAAGGRHLIVRTSWVYDAQGQNFFRTMLRLFAEREQIRVVADQHGAPTYAPHLAQGIIAGLALALSLPVFPTGTYHMAAAGETSWHGFAQAIFALASAADSVQKLPVHCRAIEAIATSQYPLPAARPLNSRLDCSKARQVLGVSLADWREGLEECYRASLAN